jgi:flavin reductase (DIM6/NTAB) family NADH-FMN oxidoreductase RutF
MMNVYLPPPALLQPRCTRQLRNALGLFATGVAVVTSEVGGERIGTTINSFGSVSLNPPLVLFSIARNAKAFAAWAQCGQFAVNILGEGQTEMCTRVALSQPDKWRGIESISGPVTGSPLLPGTLACFECETDRHYGGGDHLIVVGRVLSFRGERGDGTAPLVFFGGQLRSLASSAGE